MQMKSDRPLYANNDIEKTGNARRVLRVIWANSRRVASHIRRTLYKARLFIPGLRERHLLESMVGPLGVWTTLQNYQLNVLKRNGLAPHHRLLDIGCGPLQGGVAFIKYLDRSNYTGLDISARNLSAAYRQIGNHNLSHKNPHLILMENFDEIDLADRKFDFFWASQMLYYLNDEKMKHLLNFISMHMEKGGKFLGDIIGNRHLEMDNPKQSRFLSRIELHSINNLERLTALYGLGLRVLGEIGNYGYPKRMLLSTNVLIEITQSPNNDSN